MSSSVVVGEVMVGLAINGVHAVQNNVNPFPTFVAGGFFLGTLLFIGEFANQRLAVVLGALYLLASFLFHGQPFINAMTNIASPPRKGK